MAKSYRRRKSASKRNRRSFRKRGGSLRERVRNSRLGKFARHSLKRLPRLSQDFCKHEVKQSNKTIKGFSPYKKARHSLLKRACYEKYPKVAEIGFRDKDVGSRDVYKTHTRVPGRIWGYQD